jgi:AbrB family looped-hinge helix DNA binding protein
VRETSAAYGERAPEQPVGFKVTIADRGRMVLPAEVRERLKIKNGDWLTLILEPDGEIRMLTGKVWTNTFVKMLRKAAGPVQPGRRLSDELIAERRREAAKEEREIRAFLARRRAKKKRA